MNEWYLIRYGQSFQYSSGVNFATYIEDPRLSLYFAILAIKHARHACVTWTLINEPKDPIYFNKIITVLRAVAIGGCGGCSTPPPPPNNPNIGQSWSKWNWYLPEVGQNGTDICLKLKVKLGKIWSKFGIKDGRSCSKLWNGSQF